MARSRSNTLTPLELQIMRVLWRTGDAAVEEVCTSMNGHGAPLAPSTVRTMLGILSEKGYVEREKKGRSFRYQPRVDADDAEREILQDVLDRVYGGSVPDMLTALVKTGLASRDDLKRARKAAKRS
jgi:predicted transcriptional regulator